ncbi:hypothetical protein SVA_1177 [Sulfurifustis variabilis]|uniref:Methyltransferase domain-containing protein n=1 Tax=Sulfurifustis variabilis TaxID=1675686 RepID=A0A1B4V5C2_9GAMM|nr:methyltransferase domain-containing protein [Sulfurifustis variabilis]BAU47752.1 hypothetical protein SVA_1177 [Sulfurifustis variabilis]
MPLGREPLYALGTLLALAGSGDAVVHARDVPYVPTPPAVVEEMLRLAEVGPEDVLYDLGSGDGRIVITAARKYGARGVGVDIDPERIAESEANARAARVTDRVRFIEGDLFEVDLRPATAVTLYLTSSVNLQLRPKLLEELRAGTPVVSHDFGMQDWEPEAVVTVGRSTIYLWHVPARVAGVWRYTVTTPRGPERHRLRITQHLGTVEGRVTIGGVSYPVTGRVEGERLSYEVKRPLAGKTVTQRFEGTATGNHIVGATVSDEGESANQEWLARRGE